MIRDRLAPAKRNRTHWRASTWEPEAQSEGGSPSLCASGSPYSSLIDKGAPGPDSGRGRDSSTAPVNGAGDQRNSSTGSTPPEGTTNPFEPGGTAFGGGGNVCCI